MSTAKVAIKIYLVLIVNKQDSDTAVVMCDNNSLPNTLLREGERVYDAVIRLFHEYSDLSHDWLSIKQIVCYDTKYNLDPIVMNVVAKTTTPPDITIKQGNIIKVNKLEEISQETEFILQQAFIQ